MEKGSKQVARLAICKQSTNITMYGKQFSELKEEYFIT